MEIVNIPFVQHIGIEKEENRLVLKPTLVVKNHLQTIHAAAQYTLAETQSGFYLQLLFPEYANSVLPLLRASTVTYRHLAICEGTITMTGEFTWFVQRVDTQNNKG